MRQPLRAKGSPRTQVTLVKSIPAPLGGWNSRDGLAEMDPTDAVTLDNWMPKTAFVEIRGGYASHATGMTGAGKTLAAYNSISGTNALFCLTDSGVYNVTSAGSVGPAVAVRTNGKHQHAMFGDGTNNWLILANGVDKPLYYDGTTWVAVDALSSPSLTGLTTTDIIGVNVFKGRLFFIEKNSLSFWYLPAGSAGGALLEFNLSGECKRGGYLVAMGTQTRDGGSGQDDVLAFVTSEGEVIVYEGTNPSSASFWSKIGSFFVGRPLGRRCITQFGGDLILITENGTYPLAAALQSASVDYKLALSFKIENSFTTSARLYSANFGWEATIFPSHSAMIVNIPVVENGEHEQYVMNTITKAWCRFTDWNAETFAVMSGELYFSTGTKVVKAWTGMIDGTDNIEAYGKQAFNYFGSQGAVKQFKLFRPTLITNGAALTFLTDVDVDFADAEMGTPTAYSTTAGAVWDTSLWDASYWAAGLEVIKQWTTPGEWDGFCVAGKVKVATNLLTVQWTASDFVYERGGVL